MNASNAFRSHLMQQFVATARTQSRPPMALMGWLSEQDGTSDALSSRQRRDNHSTSLPSSSVSPSAALSSINTTASCSNNTVPPQQQRSPSPPRNLLSASLQPPLSHDTSHRRFSSSAYDDSREDDHDHDGAAEVHLSHLFQNMIQTRRTRKHFTSLASSSTSTVSLEYEQQYWKDVLDRACMCGYTAPNHKRTEPFTFKRMIAPSVATKRLADIAYHMNVRKQYDKMRDCATCDDHASEAIQANAERKRARWNSIPAFLVTVVTSKEHEIVPPSSMMTTAASTSADNEDETETNAYDLLPYVPPQTERELEDYAAACAAIQNILLSLHSENIASKWVTGPVIRTPAFRTLIDASPYDRVVGLIMVGQPDETKKSHTPKPRRHHRKLHGNVLVDL